MLFGYLYYDALAYLGLLCLQIQFSDRPDDDNIKTK